MPYPITFETIQYSTSNMAAKKQYGASVWLLVCIVAGALLGLVVKDKALYVKPLGDVLLNLLFCAVVPLVFFSIASAIASMSSMGRLGRILAAMLGVFIVTGIVASLLMILGVLLFPPALGVHISLPAPSAPASSSVGDQLVRAFTNPDFVGLLSKSNMLALIVFASIVGIATQQAGEQGKPFGAWLQAGNVVMLRVVALIMYFAPIGLGAYFCWLTGVFGKDLLGSLGRAMLLYYPVAVLYFFGGFTLYVLLAGGWGRVRTFWKHILPASMVALGTGSSMATIPVNIEAADNMGTPPDISRVVIPIGATIHMDGSCLSAILKIGLLFGLYGYDFSTPYAIATAVGVALLSGTVMSGIPGGGYIGELLIVSLYGFPPEALPIITLVGTLVDPPATMVNAIGDNVASICVARIIGKGSHTTREYK